MFAEKRKRGRPRIAPEKRFWDRVEKTESCWNWISPINQAGYGQIKVNYKAIRAHRFSWELHNGSIPEDKIIDHICHNRRCVNPDHLRVVTHAENMENLSGPRADNTSGHLGVSFDKRNNRYYAQVIKDGKNHWGGYYETAQEAAAAAKELRLQLFTHNILDRAS